MLPAIQTYNIDTHTNSFLFFNLYFTNTFCDVFISGVFVFPIRKAAKRHFYDLDPWTLERSPTDTISWPAHFHSLLTTRLGL